MSRRTLAARATHLLEVKHSRFLAQAAPVGTPEAAATFLHDISTRDATHHCWAWRIGDGYRSSDDGEPAGTAGRPILAAIDGQGFDHVMVVVTRWYGGIKLGAGGLVRAYGGAAAECLRTAEALPLVDSVRMALHVAFDDIGTVHAMIVAHAATKLAEAFDETGARITLELPVDAVDGLKSRLRDATRDRVRFDDNG